MGSQQSECLQNKGTDDPSVRDRRATPGLEICWDYSCTEEERHSFGKRNCSISLVIKSFELKQSAILSVLNLPGFLEIVQPSVPRGTALLDDEEGVGGPSPGLSPAETIASTQGWLCATCRG